MELNDIKQQLDSGDRIYLAKSSGYSKETIKKVLAGERKNEDIVKAAVVLIEGKKSLAEQIGLMFQD